MSVHHPRPRASNRWLTTLIITGVVVGSLLAPATAFARNVFFNGIKLDSSVAMKPQTFSGCEVRIDDNGDIHITAKGYKVIPTETKPQAAPPARDPNAPRQYWLITKQTQRGVAQYDVDVFVNDQFVTKVRAMDEPLVLDISRFVNRGENKVRMVAVKNLGERRVSQSPTDSLEVLVGEGIAGGGTVTVDKVHVTFKRTASETTNIREDFSFKADN
jgi:hypothetical protein